ncbi:MAG: hypothetical protein WCF65_08465 [Parachlamydiaceae bacterium]
MNKRPKGLFYCRYFDSIFQPSLNICRSLISEFDIDFLVEGSETNPLIKSPHFHQRSLPPILSEDTYDFFISEQFPFSTPEFAKEAEDLINTLKHRNPRCAIICSLRDTTPLTPLGQEHKTLEFIQRLYDYVFVHTDSHLYKLEESFSFADKIADKLVYTGFITNPNLEIEEKERKQRIVVSIGSGDFGEELLYAAIEAAPFFLDYEFSLLTGQKIPNKILAEMKILALKAGAENVSILPSVRKFEEYLSESALSISLGGPTVVSVASTRTPAIILPSGIHDQYARRMKFSTSGFIKLIATEDLATERFCSAIREALAMPPPAFEVDVSGAQTTLKEIKGSNISSTPQ